jgi:hypothetical protein
MGEAPNLETRTMDAEITKVSDGRTFIRVNDENGFIAYSMNLDTTSHKYTLYGPLAFTKEEDPKHPCFKYYPKRGTNVVGAYTIWEREVNCLYKEHIFRIVKDHAPIFGTYTEGQGEKILEVIHTLGGII